MKEQMEKKFREMEEELKQYNDTYTHLRHQKEPEYDHDLFIKFRKWQQKRMAEGNSNK